MLITEIIPYGKTKSKVLTDGDFAFALYRGEIGKFRLAPGTELSESFTENVLMPLLNRRARERVVFLLKDADRTEADLRRKLRESFTPEACIETAVSWARSKHYVDDERYASCYAEYHARGKSRKKLFFDLLQKGVSREIAEKVLENQPVDEEEQIRAELRRKRCDPASASPDERRKVIASLARKGYSWDTIERVMTGGPDE